MTDNHPSSEDPQPQEAPQLPDPGPKEPPDSSWLTGSMESIRQEAPPAERIERAQRK